MSDLKQSTYCNPLNIHNLKSARRMESIIFNFPEGSIPDYRSIADPSVIYHDGKWIMYPSYSLAYVSEDFVHWEYVDIGIENLKYSLAVVEFRGKWYLTGWMMPELYVADNTYLVATEQDG